MATSYRIDLKPPAKEIFAGHLRMGGQDPAGNTLAVNNYFITRNGKPFFITSGEFHYARFPQEYWDEELAKIKAGGVNAVASYVFWNYHEEQQGVFDWGGQKDLRRFIELCAKHDLNFVLRIGPFIHGEWRNGGLPDWLYGQPFAVRSNDPRYLAHVERFYNEIGAQVKGLLYRDGGPIIAIQIENEYMHAGAPWETVDATQPMEWIPAGSEGVSHLKILKEMAMRAGLETPLYLVTAWGAPIIEDETLPVYSGYAYPVWIDNPSPSPLYLFHDGHASPDPLSSHQVPYRYPFVNAEMQGGIQVRYGNRPVIPYAAIEAFALVRLGSGSNWLGYYMLHGGTTPRGAQGFNHERLHPQLSYDFQAPLGEYGEVRESFRALKVLHLFLDAYGETLAPMGTSLPECSTTILPTDTNRLRYCVRAAGDAGFLFVNNFQDHVEMRDFEDVTFEVETAHGRISISENKPLTVKKDACFILPFNQMLKGAHLNYATVQPLTLLQTPTYSHYFYFANEGLEPEYCFNANTVQAVQGNIVKINSTPQHLYVYPMVGQNYSLTLTTHSGEKVYVTTLTRREAEYTWKGPAWGSERVMVAEANLVFGEDAVRVTTIEATDVALTIFPQIARTIRAENVAMESESAGLGTQLHLKFAPQPIDLQVQEYANYKYVVKFPPEMWRGVNDVFLEIQYEGDTGMAFLDGQLIADNFCNGLPWVTGLKRFRSELENKELCLVFHPLQQGIFENVSSASAGRALFQGTERLVIRRIVAKPEYAAQLTVRERT